MHEIVCILNNERSKPPALAEKSKYLTINKHGNIALFKIQSISERHDEGGYANVRKYDLSVNYF